MRFNFLYKMCQNLLQGCNKGNKRKRAILKQKSGTNMVFVLIVSGKKNGENK